MKDGTRQCYAEEEEGDSAQKYPDHGWQRLLWAGSCYVVVMVLGCEEGRGMDDKPGCKVSGMEIS